MTPYHGRDVRQGGLTCRFRGPIQEHRGRNIGDERQGKDKGQQKLEDPAEDRQRVVGRRAEEHCRPGTGTTATRGTETRGRRSRPDSARCQRATHDRKEQVDECRGSPRESSCLVRRDE